MLSLLYGGASAAQVRVYDEEAEYFRGLVEPGVPFTFHGTDTDGKFEKNNLELTVNGAKDTEIHVSCSQDIGLGSVFGSFTVLEGTSKDGGAFCEGGPGGPCGPCKDGVKSLTLWYMGEAPALVEAE